MEEGIHYMRLCFKRKMSSMLILTIIFTVICCGHSTDPACIQHCTCISSVRSLKINCSQQPNETELEVFLTNLSSTVRDLDISKNLLTVLPRSLCNLDIAKLDFSHNRLTKLDSDRPCLSRLSYFIANDNHISYVNTSFFRYMTKLHSVNLKRNSLQSLDAHTFIWPSLLNLRDVDLSYNKLQVIDCWPLKMPYFMSHKGKESMSRVNVSFNQIENFINTVNFSPTQVHRGQFLHFDLRYNKLHSIKQLLIDDFKIKNPFDLRGLWDVTFLFFDNEIYCDCDMFEVMQLLKVFIPFIKNTSAEALIYLTCYKPDRLKSKMVYKLPEVDFQCSLENCTSIGQCLCVKTPANHTLRVRCVEQSFPSLPHITTTDASNITNYDLYVVNGTMGSLDLKPFANMITNIDVSFNNISILPSEFYRYLTKTKHVLLRNNHIQSLPRSVGDWDLRQVRELGLSGNPFTCDCTSLWLKKWMQKYQEKIIDINAVTCAYPEWNKGKLILDVDDSDFVCYKVDVGLVVSLSLGCLVIMFCVVSIMIYFRDYITLLLFSRFGLRFNYEYSDEERTYDVFVSYSRHDEQWVEQILCDTLEQHDPPYRVCLHYKDFEIGEPIAENISRAVQESHCTILAISPHFVQSEWCRYEFRLAHNDAITRKSTKVIIVLLEPVDHLELDRTLKMYLTTNTYLVKDDPRFWNRLRMALPTPSGRVRAYPGLNNPEDARDTVPIIN